MIESPLTLPCGAKLSNRLAKAAMTEGLGDSLGNPTPELERLYSIRGKGGCRLLLSGNVQIDADHLERPGNVIVDRPGDSADRCDALLDGLRQGGRRAVLGAGQPCRAPDDEAGQSAP